MTQRGAYIGIDAPWILAIDGGVYEALIDLNAKEETTDSSLDIKLFSKPRATKKQKETFFGHRN